MKKNLFIFALFLALTVCTNIFAQDKITVRYMGQRPIITDFVNALLARNGVDECYGIFRTDWQRRRQKQELTNGATIIADTKNGYVRYDKVRNDGSRQTIEFCYWNCSDGRHKIVAQSICSFDYDSPMAGQFDGLTMYRYDNNTHQLTWVSNFEMGTSIEEGMPTVYSLPQTGKDITAVVYDNNRMIEMLMKWNGSRFSQEQINVTYASGYSQGSGASSATASQDEYGTTVSYQGEQYIRVSTAVQLLNALGSNRNILIAADTELNLTPMLDDVSRFRTRSRMWTSDISGGISDGRDVVASEEVFDGRQLTLVNFQGLKIVGEHNSKIVVEPRYAFCLRFVDCKQCEIHNLTIGHTIGGYCSGGVIGDLRGFHMYVANCDLYGCGTYGLDLDSSNSFELRKSNIYECTYGIMTMRNVISMSATRCNFFNNREFSLVEGRNCAGIVFDDCWFYNNEGTLFSLNSMFYLRNCQVYHPESLLGSIEMADQTGGNNEFGEKFFGHGVLGEELEVRNKSIGPDIR